MGKTDLPPGFRFHPTDVELVKYHLKRKVMGKKPCVEYIAEVNIYKYAPWDLPDKSCLRSRDLNWYFFCPREKKYGSGARMNRANEFGFWKTTGKDRQVLYKNAAVGMIKTLIFHRGRAPRGDRTDWVMHEYRLEDKDLAEQGIVQDCFVLCKIFQKDGLGPRNGAQYGAPFNEEEWSDEEELNDNNIEPVFYTGSSMLAPLQPSTETSPMISTASKSSCLLSESGPSETVLTTAGPSETVLTTAGPSETVLTSSGPSETVLTTARPSETVLTTAGPSETVLSTVGSSETVLSTVGSSETVLTTDEVFPPVPYNNSFQTENVEYHIGENVEAVLESSPGNDVYNDLGDIGVAKLGKQQSIFTLGCQFPVDYLELDDLKPSQNNFTECNASSSASLYSDYISFDDLMHHPLFPPW